MAAKESGLRLAPPTSAPSISSWLMRRGGVVGLDAAAVENAHGCGNLLAEKLRDFSANDAVRFGGHFGRCGFAGADGPDRLIGDDDGRGGLGGDAGECTGDLGLQNLLGQAAFALGKHFADADDGDDAVLERGVELLVDDLVGLGEILAALGVADEGVRAADGHQLADGGLAGVGALFGEVDVLRADGDVGAVGGGESTVGRRTGEGNRAISSRVWPATRGKKASTKALASAGVLYIFQLAAIRLSVPLWLDPQVDFRVLIWERCVMNGTVDGGLRD